MKLRFRAHYADTDFAIIEESHRIRKIPSLADPTVAAAEFEIAVACPNDHGVVCSVGVLIAHQQMLDSGEVSDRERVAHLDTAGAFRFEHHALVGGPGVDGESAHPARDRAVAR